MSSLKQFLATTSGMLVMDSVKYYYDVFTRAKRVKSLTPAEVYAKAKRKKKNRAVKKAKIASRKHK
ncbi:MAG: hypothetical protein MJ209_00255 [archaeon]|nr:hypothetical protein [archaeon]